MMKSFFCIALCLCFICKAQEKVHFNGFVAEFNEPEHIEKTNDTKIIIYALPNGNTIPWTRGRKMEPGMDWHFDLQHIDAQTEYLRHLYPKQNIIIAYTMSDKMSFPLWTKEQKNSKLEAKKFVEFVLAKYKAYKPKISLSCHGGGGSFLFDIINAYPKIPRYIERIVFLDAVYNYEDSLHTDKLVKWIKNGGILNVTSYRDNMVIYHGKSIVSLSGGTGCCSEWIAKNLSKRLNLTYSKDKDFEYYFDQQGKVFIYIKNNPNGNIYHTILVYRNGFINSMLCGTSNFTNKYVCWSENVAYKQYIKAAPEFVKDCQISIEEFRKQAEKLSHDSYDSLVYKMFETGCTPKFMDEWKRIDCQITDSTGKIIHAFYFVKPDFLCVGTNEDFIRVPMQPKTAQRIANRLGAFLSTPKISDDIYKIADIKLQTEPLTENREASATFFYHNDLIEKQRAGRIGLIAGHKKDVVLSSKIMQCDRPDREALYGWHMLDGTPIQNVYVGHVDWYVDYSHGIRLVRRDIWVDGIKMDYLDVFADKRLAPILTYEFPVLFTAYPTKE
jgi:hypothetical protein